MRIMTVFVPTLFGSLGLAFAMFDAEVIPLPVKVLIILIATVIAATSNYYAVFLPLRIKVTERQQTIAKIPLDEFVREYESYTNNRDMIRVSVMLPERSIRRPWSHQLRMWLDLGGYSDDERKIVYSPGQGVCGKAFADSASYWYDHQKGQDQFLNNPPFADSVNRNVSSRLCVPIFRDNENKDILLGVLSIDSPEGIEYSKLDDEKVQELGRQAATNVGVVLSL